jgi:uncharacterized protein YjbI with pentapeptide repeats
MSEHDLQLLPAFGVIISDRGVLVIGPMEFGAGTDPDFAPRLASFRTAVELALSGQVEPSLTFDGPVPESTGNVILRTPGPAQFGLHRLDGAAGTCITWNRSADSLVGIDLNDLVFQRAGAVFENQAWFEIVPLEALERLDAAARMDPVRIDEAELAGESDQLVDFSAYGAVVPWHGTVDFNASDSFIVLRNDIPVALYVADVDDDDDEDDAFPPREAIRCRPAPLLVQGEPIAPGSLERVDLRGANLAGWDLPGVSFRQSDLRGADFSDCNLRGACFAHVRADNAIFDRANMVGSDWSSAFAPEARFVEASLAGAEIVYAELERTVMRSADLRGANLNGVTVGEADWVRVDLTNATIGEAAFITDTDLSHAIVAGAEFDGCDLSGSVLEGVDLGSASLEDVTLPE